MRVDKSKQGINEVSQSPRQKETNARQFQHQQLVFDKSKAGFSQQSSIKQSNNVTLSRITDTQIEQINRKQQQLFENDINQKLQNLMSFSRFDGKNNLSDQSNLQTSISNTIIPNKIVKHSKLDVIQKLNSSEDPIIQEAKKEKTNSSGEGNSRSLRIISEDQQEQQQQLIHAPHPPPTINLLPPLSQDQPMSSIRYGNHQRIANGQQSYNNPQSNIQSIGVNNPFGHGHAHHQSLSETRSLKSFKSLQDQRLARQLNRRQDTSNQGSNGSQTRQRSNVREMISSQQEKLLFETKFKGSLDKLDEFERQWSGFKSLQQYPSNVPHLSSKNLEVQQNTRLEQIGKLNSSFDNSNSSPNILTSQTSTNYQTQQVFPKKESSKDMRIKTNLELKNQLDQINESPRESILQSPSSSNNEKIRAALGLPQKNAFQSVQKHQSTNEKQKECKTLKIDLNEEKQPNQEQKLLKEISKEKSMEDKQPDNKNKQQEKSQSKKLIMPNANKQSTGQGININTISQQQQIKPQEQGRNLNTQKNQSSLTSTTIASMQPKNDLVERVIESIKVLNQKEEEVKQQKQQPVQKPKISKEAAIQETQQLQMNQTRRRTNTLTTGERPNLLQMKAANINQQQNQPSTILAKENTQPRQQQIAELKKQVSQSHAQQQNQGEIKKIQPSSTTNQGSLPQGFIGNSFVKIAQEKQQEKQELINKINDKVDRVEQNFTSDPYQFQNPPRQNQKPIISSSNNSNTVNANNQPQQKTHTILSQASKDKVEQLRKAFTSNKEVVQSRSTKNLNIQGQQQTTGSSVQQPIQIVSQKQSQNFQSKPQSNVSSQISTPVAQITQKQSIQQNQVPIKSEKLTKRADISLVNDNQPNINISMNMGANQNSNVQLSIASGTPSKGQINSLKKSNQITPQNKISTGSPTHLNSVGGSIQANQQLKAPIDHQNLHSKRNSQFSSAIGQQTQNTTTIVHQKGKNRRQPTQTQFDQTSSNLIKMDQASKREIAKKQFELIEKPEKSKQRTMLDEYFQGSNNDSKSQITQSGKTSSNTSKVLSLSKHKDKSKAQDVLDQDLAEIEREFLERPKNSNFQPIQQPSINWNASPEKQMQEKKLFPGGKKINQFFEQSIPNEPPKSHREYTSYNQDERPIKQNQAINWLSGEQQNFPHLQQQIRLERPASQTLILQSSPPKENYQEPSHEQNGDSDQKRKQSDTSDETQNLIEKRLNRLMEQTRRRLINQDDEDEEDMQDADFSSSQISDEHQTYSINLDSNRQINEALNKIEETNRHQNQMRNKAQTPLVNSQTNNFQTSHAQVGVYQHQPYPYELSSQAYPPQYAQQPIYYQNQYNPHLITIINPSAGLQHPQQQKPQPQNPNIPSSQQAYLTQQSPTHEQRIILNSIQDNGASGGSPSQQNQKKLMFAQQQQQYSTQIGIPQGSQNMNPVNASMIIGTESQFFYPSQSIAQIPSHSNQDQQLIGNNEDTESINILPPKQYSQVILPSQYQTQLVYQQQQPVLYQHGQITAIQQPYYLVGYPPPPHQQQNYLNPGLPVLQNPSIQHQYIPPQMRQANESFSSLGMHQISLNRPYYESHSPAERSRDDQIQLSQGSQSNKNSPSQAIRDNNQSLQNSAEKRRRENFVENM